MEKKNFDLYTDEEREQLLMHWWQYYGKVPYTLAEAEKFRELVKKDSMLVRGIALISFGLGTSSQVFIYAMRSGAFDAVIEAFKATMQSKEFKALEELMDDKFMDEIVGTFNNPEPPVPMSVEQIVDSVKGMVGKDIGGYTIVDVTPISINEDDKILTVRNLLDVYSDCLIKTCEVNNDEPTVDFVLGEGVQFVSVFSAERIEKNKEKIIELIDELPKIEKGISFLTLCTDKHGRQWTGEHSKMDILVMLGLASGALQFTLPREDWDALPGGMPYVIRNKENERVVGNKPAEYKKVVEDFKNRNSKIGD